MAADNETPATDETAALTPLTPAHWTRMEILDLFNAGLMRQSEARQALGLPPAASGDMPRAQAVDLFRDGLLTHDEARRALGYDPIVDGDDEAGEPESEV